MSVSPSPVPPAPGRIRLLPPLPQPGLPPLDASGRAVLGHVANGANVVVLGAPGTGKTTVALSLLAQAVAVGRDAVLLAPTRSRADALRSRAASLLGGGHGDGAVRVRTPVALALSILTTSLTRRADPLPAPVLLAGAEEDAVLASLVQAVDWPGLPPQATASPAFRSELRSLLARSGELGVSAEDLAAMGHALDIPLWQAASHLLRTWDAQGRPSAQRRSEIRKMDSARLQDRAREALETWVADGVTEPRPVPDLVVVDDYQDCTAATARLLAGLSRPDSSGQRAQVAVLGDPDVAVETFRGGAPSLLVEAEDRSGLAARRLVLRTLHRGVPSLAALWRDQASRLPVTGTGLHRRPDLPGDDPGTAGSASAARPGPGRCGVSVLVAGSAAQEAAHVARALREEHVRYGTPWDQMAVIARSAQQGRAVGRELRRRGVPVTAATPAVLLRAEPAAAALLAVSRAGLEGRLGDDSRSPDRAAAVDLLTSPLVGLTTPDLRRLRRHVEEQPAQRAREEVLLGLLTSPCRARLLAQETADGPVGTRAGLLAQGAQVVAAVREVVRQAREAVSSPVATGPGAGRGRVDIEALLWAAWSASGRAEVWRSAVLEAAGPPGGGDETAAQAADHDLDVVTALFKRAEVWNARNPEASAEEFLDELALEELPSDTVAPQGVRPPSVTVLTPAAAAGRQWEVVVVTGLVRGSWPDLRLRDSLTHASLLVDVVTSRVPLGGDGAARGRPDPVSARHQVRADERRMLLCSLTRASRRLLVSATADDDHVPSSFLTEVAWAAGTGLSRGAPGGGGTEARGGAGGTEAAEGAVSPGSLAPAQDVGDLTLRGLVGELRHALTLGHLEGAAPLERSRADHAAQVLAGLARAGVAEASPQTWAGLGGPTSHRRLVAPGRAVSVSPSDVESLCACPLRWFLGRQGGSPGVSRARSLGTLVHELAEQAQREGLRGQELTDLLEHRLEELGYPDTWLGGLAAQRVRDMVGRLGCYLSSVPGHVDVEQAIDVRLSLPLPAAAGSAGSAAAPDAPSGPGGSPAPGDPGDPSQGAADGDVSAPVVPVRLRGRIDRVEHLDSRGATAPAASGDSGSLPQGHGARVRVVDLKTSGSVPDDPEHHPQLGTYRLALEAKGYEVVGAGLVLLGRTPTRKDGGVVLSPPGAALAPSPDPEDGRHWAADLVARAALSASGDVLQARTGRHCRWCSVKDSCPVGSEGRRLWQ